MTQNQIIKKFQNDIDKLNSQRINWIILSTVLSISAISIIFFWESLVNFNSITVWWGISISGFLMTILWWYWTMSLVRKILNYQSNIIEILVEITTDVKDIRQEVLEFLNKN